MTSLSVIVPVYNQAGFLEVALASVRRQSIEQWECIVIDDGSTDGSRGVIDLYSARDSRFISVHQKNRGVSAARNLGLEHARGRYVLFLDADDTICSRMSELLIALLDKNEDVGVAYGGHDRIDERGNRIRSVRAPRSHQGKLVQRLLVSNLFPINAAIVRREEIEKHGVGFQEKEMLEDWIFWLRLALAGVHFKSVDEIVSSYRQLEEGRSSHVLKNTQGSERILRKVMVEASEKYAISRRFQRLAYIALYLRRYLEALELKDEEAKDYCEERLKELDYLTLFGLSSYHVYVLGLYLDLQEATGNIPILEPLVSGRRIARKMVGRRSRESRRKCDRP